MYIGINIPEDTTRQQHLGGLLQDIENHLPINETYKNKNVKPGSPVRVVNEVFNAGMARESVQVWISKKHFTV